MTEASVTVRSRAECEHRFSAAAPTVIDRVRRVLPPNQKSLSMICADSTVDSQAGSCYGDSGGPAFTRSGFCLQFFHMSLYLYSGNLLMVHSVSGLWELLLETQVAAVSKHYQMSTISLEILRA